MQPKWLLLPLACLCVGALAAGTLIVSLTDPSGAVVPGAEVRAEGPAGSAAAQTTQKDGSATFSNLPAGSYRVVVQRKGFAGAERPVEVKEAGETRLNVGLTIAPQETAVDVEEKASPSANTDTNYRALRNAPLSESFVVENLELKRDAGTLVFRTGTISFTAPVMGRVVTAVFSGQGSFHLIPAIQFEADHLNLITGRAQMDEEFESAVLLFTDDTYHEMKRSLKTPADGSRNEVVLRDLRHRLRRRAETPRSMGEYLMQGDDVPNLDAEILTDLYNPKAEGFFSAYIQGRKHSDLRFFLKPLGVLPDLPSTEEVGLINVDTSESQDGILYLTHRLAEWKDGTARIDEDRRIAAAKHYKIETVIGKNEHLTSIADLRFEPLRDGDRVIRLSLLPNLRVSGVSMSGKNISFIQEGRKLDSSFYLVLPESTVKGKMEDVTIEYAGDKVIYNAGGGSFAVGARTDWYPGLNIFHDRATYDLTFKVPRRYTLVSVGQEAGSGREGDFSITHWVSEVPLAVAGFNYGEFKRKDASDGGYNFSVYATSELPDYMRHIGLGAGMTPSALASSTLVDAENAMRCFRYWFGDVPFGRIAITQQPQFNFGQSWPSLVYLPLFAFLDSTQRYMMLGSGTFKFTEFIDEVTPHEVSHQWWGHLVGWNSYHDQWLSEGFADFSAGLFLEATEKDRGKYLKYWERSRKRIMDRTSFGYAPNDAGPVWMGLRLNTFKTPDAYNSLVYPKGGYVLHMLRYLMRDSETGDAGFVAMMHDFTSKYAGKNASSGDFQAIVEQHMKPQMDLDGSNRMNWFFGEWLYGTQVPAYRLSYRLTPEPDGKVLFSGKVTQSQVGDGFRMRVPIYLDFGVAGGPVRLTNVGIIGNNSSSEIKFRLPRKPKKVMLNYNSDVLVREASVEEL